MSNSFRPASKSGQTGRFTKRPYSSSRGGATSGRSRSFRGSKNGGGRKMSVFSDESKFINRAIVTETMENFVPEHKFADFAIDDKLKANLAKLGFVLPTPIQDRAIPHVLRGDDVVGIANTGTGKTLAFALPLLHQVLQNPKQKILVVAPTRELAQQIDAELSRFASSVGVSSVVAVGGLPIYKQVGALKKSYTFVIGTPGRLMDLRKRGAIDFTKFNTVVLDEADRMLDMGFINDIRSILSDIPTERQSLCFSATMSREIEALINQFLKNQVTISVKTRDTSKSIDQDIVRINPGETKLETLAGLLAQAEFGKVLVFGQTKRGVENLSRDLIKKGFKSEAVHGDKTQSRRQRALASFKKNQVQVLVATDVAARGLDIPDVSHVINFDLPATYDDYIHRIGRTGRGGKTGKALTFIDKGGARASRPAGRPSQGRPRFSRPRSY